MLERRRKNWAEIFFGKCFFGKKHFLARKFLGKHFFCPNKKIAKKNLQFFFAICWQKKCYSQQNNFGQHFCQGKQIYLAKVSVKISFWPNVSVDKKSIGQKKKCWPTNLVWPKFSLTKKKFVHKKNLSQKFVWPTFFLGPTNFFGQQNLFCQCCYWESVLPLPCPLSELGKYARKQARTLIQYRTVQKCCKTQKQ